MKLKYSAERRAIAKMLASCIVDPENAYSHLLPFIAFERLDVRADIIKSVINAT